MYLFAITIFLCISYFVIAYLFNLFFIKDSGHLPTKPFFSVALIIMASLLGYWITFGIPDEIWSNRFLHAYGGGFLAFLVCFLVVKDEGLTITKFQFFVISALLVTSLGVSNEILECILQNFFGMTFSTSINDTWLDLVSNSVGILVASIVFVPFIGKIKK